MAPVALTTLCTPRSGRSTVAQALDAVRRSTAKRNEPSCRSQRRRPARRRSAEAVRDRRRGGRPARRSTGSSAHTTLRPGDLGEVAVEAGQQGVERAVVLEEVDLDVEQDRAVQRQLEVGAVALVGLDHEPARHPSSGRRCRRRRRRRRRRSSAPDRPRRGSASASTWSSSCRACRRRRSIGPGRRSTPACPARRSVGMPSSRAAASSMVRAGIAVDDVTASQPTTMRGAVADVDVDAGRPHPVEHRLVPEVAARHVCGPSGRGRWRSRDMPGPPTPITCRRRGRDRSRGARGASVGSTAVTVGPG